MVLNSKINVLAPETAPFLGLNQGGGGMLDLEFFRKKIFHKKFLVQNLFLSDVDYISADFLNVLFHTWVGAGELRHFPIFFIFHFLNLIMHIGAPLSFRLVAFWSQDTWCLQCPTCP